MASQPRSQDKADGLKQFDDDRPIQVVFDEQELPGEQKADRQKARAAKMPDIVVSNMKRFSWIIAAGDVILLLIFAYGGEVTHELFFPDSLILSVLHAALPFALIWFPVAFSTGALGDPRILRPRDFLARAVGAWLIAAPLGIVVRGWLINRAVIPMTFLLVTYAVGLGCFVGWRLAFIFATKLNSFRKIPKPKGVE